MFKGSSNKNAQKIVSKSEATIIGESCVFEGNIKEGADITILGKVKGNLDVKGLATIEESGIIEGDLLSVDAIIRGTVTGDVKITENLRLDSTSKINGDIEYNVISVEEGAMFNGRCSRMSAKDTKIKDIKDIKKQDVNAQKAK
ncbi:MAG: polymer-forming cytoskeletal protein [Peptostreptococcaceae bacterium]|jgi:cytoskeletal protein CcmA (bactofilin family)|nr:polymer-forming cytoskeletal protein [Peptostreptococcaceae bacterium]